MSRFGVSGFALRAFWGLIEWHRWLGRTGTKMDV